MEEIEGVHYMTEGGSGILAYRERAIEALKRAKELDSKKKIISVWEDYQTIKLVDLNSVKRRGLQIIRVKLPTGRIVWMEKQVAIKNGFINE